VEYDLNLSMLFTELDLLRRPAAARAAGFDAVEFWWPFAEPVPADAEVERFARAIEDAGVRLVGLNFHAGDMPAGERGVLSHPRRAREFAANLDVVADLGRRLGCRKFNALYGTRLDGVSAAEQDEVAAASLARAAEVVGGFGGAVLLEPVSGTPGYPLLTAADAAAVIERVGADNVRLLFDVYHLVVNGDDPWAVLSERAGSIGHVQIADAPGRGAPGTGEIDFERFWPALAAAGYDGHVGLEYRPGGPSAGSFGWIRR